MNEKLIQKWKDSGLLNDLHLSDSTFETAKLELRKYFIENADKVNIDLEKMRNNSNGIDFHTYVENLINDTDILD